MSDEYVHVAFRSKESGRYLFHVKWPQDEWNRFVAAAELRGETLEEFIAEAIRWAVIEGGVELVEQDHGTSR